MVFMGWGGLFSSFFFLITELLSVLSIYNFHRFQFLNPKVVACRIIFAEFGISNFKPKQLLIPCQKINQPTIFPRPTQIPATGDQDISLGGLGIPHQKRGISLHLLDEDKVYLEVGLDLSGYFQTPWAYQKKSGFPCH